jgi:glycosyltransferase involved in cell wall biosynthesis
MRIAQVAPLAESVPPRLYGGTERVASWLTEELVRKGHQVTLFASGDSETAAELVACAPQGLRLAGIRDHTASHLAMLAKVRERQASFDVIHFHLDLLQHAMFTDLAHKCVTTLHGRLDLPDFLPVYQAFPQMPLISISKGQRKPMPATANWLATVYHGLPLGPGPVLGEGGDYLAFLGRITPEKRPDRAIEIAKRAGMPLKIAAKVDPVDEDYFRNRIEPLLNDPLIEFLGEIDDARKVPFLASARALLFPIDWPEPFGLAMIEAMSVGTPVIAWRNGSVPEIVEEGVSGFIVDSIADAAAACIRSGTMDRTRVQAYFDRNFTAERMACDYLEAFDRLLGSPASSAGPQNRRRAMNQSVGSAK